MAGTIDMTNEGLPLNSTADSTVQSGGGGTIDMFGGSGMHLSHTPISCVQKGGGSGSIEMFGQEGLLSKSPSSLYGQKQPSDKGE